MDNTRILIVDDEEIVRDSIREILVPRQKEASGLDEAAFDLFDEAEPVVTTEASRNHPIFEFDEANNGKAGLAKVEKAVAEGKPYAVIFLDMRMPGWDGLKTCTEIRKVDPKAQIFFVTAFTDRSIEEIVQQAGGDVGYLSKPFVHEEIIQLASKGVHDWYRMTSLERLLEIIGQIGLGNSQLRSLLINILHQISDYVGTEYAVLGKRDDAGKFEEIATTGFGAERINVERFFTLITPEQSDKIGLIEGVLTCPMGNYFILAIPTRKNWFNQEKSYLLNLFMENAIRAIKNAELNESLVQKEKLSAIGQAISMVMHDIKTPIAQIQTITELIQSDPEDAEEISELAEMIEESTQHAMDIIYDVRDFVRNASLTKEPIPLTEYLEEIASEVRKKSAETAVRLEVKTSEKELIAMGDPKKLKRVMVNLINNAMEAMESHAVDDPLVTLSGHQEANQVVLTIQDNGPGIPANIQPTLFEPFVTKGKENGTGLGLAIVKQIIEAHEGEISVDSSKQGAIFTICLPK